MQSAVLCLWAWLNVNVCVLWQQVHLLQKAARVAVVVCVWGGGVCYEWILSPQGGTLLNCEQCEVQAVLSVFLCRAHYHSCLPSGLDPDT
jgi:hypothetical protein